MRNGCNTELFVEMRDLFAPYADRSSYRAQTPRSSVTRVTSRQSEQRSREGASGISVRNRVSNIGRRDSRECRRACTKNFFCLPGPNSRTVPRTNQKVVLEQKGLGKKL